MSEDELYPTPDLPPVVEELFPGADPWIDYEFTPLRERIFRVLRPFALMHRHGAERGELAIQRGVASAASYVTSGDFEDVFELLLQLGDSEFAEQVSGDDRYMGLEEGM